MRYKVTLQYDGTNYSGWQSQDNAISVQEIIEQKLNIRLQKQIGVVGCGRTDTGVHASHYVLHFDHDEEIDTLDLKYALNKLLPVDISITELEPVSNFFHARFDARSRSYVYRIHAEKNPFLHRFSYFFPPILKADFNKMEQFSKLILEYNEFEPFCKTNTDVKTKKCSLKESRWIFDRENDIFEYHISADRFLRGMVRLIVGTSIQLGLSKTTIEEVKDSMDRQVGLKKPLSVPPQGLFLSRIKY